MSSRPPRCLALVLAIALAGPHVAAGQQTKEEWVQQIEALLPRLDQARLVADSARADYERRMNREQPTESLKIGLLQVVVIPGESAPARDVVGAVWQRDYAPFVDRSSALDRNRIFFQWAMELTPYEAPSGETRIVSARRWKSQAYMEQQVQRAVGELLRSDLEGTHFESSWVANSLIPPEDAQRLYRDAAVVPSFAVRGCLLGDAAACLTSFGLQTDAYPIDDWYDSDERRLLVYAQVAVTGRFPAQLGTQCAEGSNLECDAILQSYVDEGQDSNWAAPLGTEARSSLLWYALQQGGPGAWGRLLDHAEGTPLEALEAASAQDGATLVLGWRQWLLQHRPESHAGLGSLALGAIFWTLVLVTFAARSTRWRLA